MQEEIFPYTVSQFSKEICFLPVSPPWLGSCRLCRNNFENDRYAWEYKNVPGILRSGDGELAFRVSEEVCKLRAVISTAQIVSQLQKKVAYTQDTKSCVQLNCSRNRILGKISSIFYRTLASLVPNSSRAVPFNFWGKGSTAREEGLGTRLDP